MSKVHPSKSPKVSLAAGNEADSVMSAGNCYVGVLVSVNPSTGHCNVRLDKPATHIENCYWAAGAIFSPLLGFKVKTVPALGTKVVVLYGNPSFIIQMLPSESGDDISGTDNSSTGYNTRKDSGIYGTGAVSHSVLEANVLEGEFDISNSFGVGLLFLNNIMTMRAGDRAKIETHLLRDMVRIVSECFEHITPTGVESVYNDGHPNEEESLSSYDHEVYNRSDSKSPKASVSDNQVAFSDDEDFVSQYKHRYRRYKGWLGDFIHMFVTDPADTASSVLTGKAYIKIGNDGSMLHRSVSEIAFERVCRIVVPKRLQHPDSPEGDLSDEVDELPEEPIKEWEPTNPHHDAYQLREYARYLANFKGLCRFRQKTKDFSVPKESDVPEPSPNNKEEDRKTINPRNRHINTYSTIRLMRDGSTLIHDGYGSCYYSGRGLVQISSPYAIHMDTGGDFVVVANDVFLKARNGVEMVAVTGGITQKSRTHMNSLCEKGPVWLKSDAQEGDSSVGVMLDAPGNRIISNAGKDNMVQSEDGDVTVDAPKGSIFVKAFRTLRLESVGDTLMQAGKTLFLNANKMFQRAVSVINIQNRLFVDRSGKTRVRGGLDMVGSLSVKGAIYGPPVVGKALTTESPPPHLNHIRVLEDDITVDIDQTVSSTLNSIASARPTIKVDSLVRSMVWRFDSSRHPKDDSLYSMILPHAQDFIMTHASSFTEFVEWKFSEDTLLPAERTDSTSLPWPGKTLQNELHHPFGVGHNLTTPSPEENWTQTNLTARPTSRRVIE